MHEPSGVTWSKSSYSADQGDCVEVAGTGVDVRVRDTKDRAAGALAFGPDQWRAFVVDLTK